jgi:hypothetical protein
LWRTGLTIDYTALYEHVNKDNFPDNNRLEFCNFGVFETKMQATRKAQNPRMLERVHSALLAAGDHAAVRLAF